MLGIVRKAPVGAYSGERVKDGMSDCLQHYLTKGEELPNSESPNANLIFAFILNAFFVYLFFSFFYSGTCVLLFVVVKNGNMYIFALNFQ